MANTPNWTGPWNISTVYNAYDLVSFGGATWIATVGNAGSQPGSTAAWAIFAQAGKNGINSWRGVWQSTTLYNAFDAVTYNGTSYVSLTNLNQSNVPSSNSNFWAILAGAGGPGPAGDFTFVGVWSATVGYVLNDIVSYNGSSYAVTGSPTVGINPATDTGNWSLIASVGAQGPAGPQGVQGATGLGFTWKGAWSPLASYFVNDVVGLLGASYVAVTPNVDVNPSTDNGSTWQIIASPGLPPNGVTWTAGFGPPVAAAPVGSLYSNQTGSMGSPPTHTLYVYTQIGWIGVV
jgi:hypothetical protein